jgi:exodeoxyribonuclease III
MVRSFTFCSKQSGNVACVKIATFNVNSFKTRLNIVLDWLSTHQPDVLMLQELKGLEVSEDEIKAAGYHLNFVGQKAYNGVAMITREPAAVITRALPGDDSDEQARYIEIDYKGVRFINIYAPNGNPIDTEKFPYKLNWLKRLYARLCDLRAEQRDCLIAGDFNIIPDDIDAASPKDWAHDALFQPESRALYRAMINLGFTDALRVTHPQQTGLYTFWDYQAGAWPRNNGIRIDHILLSPVLADKLTRCEIDKAPRALEKPSDHTPVFCEISL